MVLESLSNAKSGGTGAPHDMALTRTLEVKGESL
jgi:hypothetical protein